MKRRNLLVVCLLLWTVSFYAAKVDTLMVHSPAMNRDIQVIVVSPDVAHGEPSVKCPTIYLLHGFGGNALTWPNLKPELAQISDEKGVIFVCPDGRDSWYWDSPTNPEYRYETFISSELVQFMDKQYQTIADRKARAITGLSMGGHGALWNAIRHKDIFGAAGSTSGGVDIRPFPKSWKMENQLGALATNQQVWDNHTVINQIDTLKDGDLALIIDCGSDDFFLEVNRNLDKLLWEHKINHDFIIRPGGHTSTYWNNSIDYQLLFFDKFFKKRL